MIRFIAFAAAALATAGAPALAQDTSDFPGKDPITFIIPFAPGGSVDSGFRILVPALEKELGARIDVVNKGGAGGQTGITDFIRSAKPDGHTLVNVGLPTVMTQYLDPERAAIYKREDFQPIAQAWSGSYGIAVKSDSPIKDFKGLIDEAKTKPGEVTIGDSGLMAGPHLMVSLVESVAGVKFRSVHFDGGSAANAGLLGGHVAAMGGGASDFSAANEAGTVRVLAIATEAERENMKGVPTMTSQGVPLVFQTIQGVAVPAGTPEPVVRKLEAAFKTALSDPRVQEEMLKYGNPANFAGADEFAATWQKYEADLKPVIGKLLAENAK